MNIPTFTAVRQETFTVEFATYSTTPEVYFELITDMPNKVNTIIEAVVTWTEGFTYKIWYATKAHHNDGMEIEQAMEEIGSVISAGLQPFSGVMDGCVVVFAGGKQTSYSTEQEATDYVTQFV